MRYFNFGFVGLGGGERRAFTTRWLLSLPVVWALAGAAAGCAHSSPAAKAPGEERVYAQVVSSADRLDADRALDAGRKPVELLQLIGVGSGAKVADLAAGEGYTTELLARTVGPTGAVYAHNTPALIKQFPAVAKALDARLGRPGLEHVTKLEREMEAPLPTEARGLDAVVMNLFYHDTYWLGVDRAKMNRAIFDALRPGGVFVVIDHSAKPGAGATQVSTLHRIEQKLVQDELTAAGFQLQSESSFLRNPADARDWNVFDERRRGTTDRFALKFVKRP